MTTQNSFNYFKMNLEVICLAVMYYVRYQLSFSQVEDILHERAADISSKIVQFWVNHFADQVCNRNSKKEGGLAFELAIAFGRSFRQNKLRTLYLWSAVDHEGELLECYASKRRKNSAPKKFLRKTIRKH